MNLIAFMSLVILIVTIVTLAFGIIAYILYKMRERNRKKKISMTYEEKITELDVEYIFLER